MHQKEENIHKLTLTVIMTPLRSLVIKTQDGNDDKGNFTKLASYWLHWSQCDHSNNDDIIKISITKQTPDKKVIPVIMPVKINHISTNYIPSYILLISLALNVVSHFRKLQKKAH